MCCWCSKALKGSRFATQGFGCPTGAGRKAQHLNSPEGPKVEGSNPWFETHGRKHAQPRAIESASPPRIQDLCSPIPCNRCGLDTHNRSIPNELQVIATTGEYPEITAAMHVTAINTTTANAAGRPVQQHLRRGHSPSVSRVFNSKRRGARSIEDPKTRGKFPL